MMGTLHLVGALRLTHLGTIPASGVILQPIAGVDPAAVGDFVIIHYQAKAFRLGRRYLSQPRRATNIDSSL